MTYETKLMNYKESQRFQSFYNLKIGTECELNLTGNDECYFVCFELFPREIKTIQKFENNL